MPKPPGPLFGKGLMSCSDYDLEYVPPRAVVVPALFPLFPPGTSRALTMLTPPLRAMVARPGTRAAPERNRSMKTRIMLIVGVAAVCLGGCARPRLMTPQIAPWVQTASWERMQQSIPNSRWTPGGDQIAVVNRIDERLRPAAIRVCQRSFRDPESCSGLFRARTLEVRFNDQRINAFVGDKYDLVLLGGLISHAGSDDEIASVLTHEYSHALLRHPQKSMSNRLGGMLIGMAIGAAVGAKTDEPDFVSLGARVGFEAGNLVFSRAMELEADHLGMFILHEAGYDIRAASQFHIRMRNIQSGGATVGPKGLLGFISTHPPPERRIDKMIATEELIEAGVRRPTWKKK